MVKQRSKIVTQGEKKLLIRKKNILLFTFKDFIRLVCENKQKFSFQDKNNFFRKINIQIVIFGVEIHTLRL